MANGWHSSLADRIWLILTAMGDGLVLGIVVGAFIVKNPRVVAMGIPLLLITSLTVNIIKAVFPSLRPVEMLDAVHVVGPLLRSGSFPSGHAAAAMAAGLSIAFLLLLQINGIIGSVHRFFNRHFTNLRRRAFPQGCAGGHGLCFCPILDCKGTVRTVYRKPDSRSTFFPRQDHFGPHFGWKSLPHSSRCSSMVRTTLNCLRYRWLWLRWCSFGSQ